MLRRRLNKPVFLHGFSNQYYVEVEEGWLSLKSMWHGAGVYWLANGRVTVDDNHYLILNERQPYTIEIEQETAVESFCIFFPARWAGDVLRNFIKPIDRLLDEDVGETAVSFYDVLHRHDEWVTPILQRLRQAHKQGLVDEGRQTEILHELLAAMLQVQRQVYREAAKLPAARTTTRKELYRRLHTGRDFIRDNLQQPISLETAAQAVALSPYHFLRSFKQLFGQTPHAYLTDQRLKRAKQLLANTEMPVTDICFEVGFQSLGSFSALFQRYIGRSPSQFRQQNSYLTQ